MYVCVKQTQAYPFCIPKRTLSRLRVSKYIQSACMRMGSNTHVQSGLCQQKKKCKDVPLFVCCNYHEHTRTVTISCKSVSHCVSREPSLRRLSKKLRQSAAKDIVMAKIHMLPLRANLQPDEPLKKLIAARQLDKSEHRRMRCPKEKSRPKRLKFGQRPKWVP